MAGSLSNPHSRCEESPYEQADVVWRATPRRRPMRGSVSRRRPAGRKAVAMRYAPQKGTPFVSAAEGRTVAWPFVTTGTILAYGVTPCYTPVGVSQAFCRQAARVGVVMRCAHLPLSAPQRPKRNRVTWRTPPEEVASGSTNVPVLTTKKLYSFDSTREEKTIEPALTKHHNLCRLFSALDQCAAGMWVRHSPERCAGERWHDEFRSCQIDGRSKTQWR